MSIYEKYYLLFCSVLLYNINTFSKCCDCGGKQYKIILCGFDKNWAITQLCFFHFDYNQNDLAKCGLVIPRYKNEEYIGGDYAESIKEILYTKIHEYDLSLNNCLCFRKKAKLYITVYNDGDTNNIKANLNKANAVIFVCSNLQTLDETKNFLNNSGIAETNIPVVVELLHLNVEYKAHTTYLDATHFNVYTMDGLLPQNTQHKEIVFNNPKSRFVSQMYDTSYQAKIMRKFINSL